MAFSQPTVPTLWVTGDSTANHADHRGWGDPLVHYFDPTKITVINRARGGRSSRTFFTEGLWERVCAELKPGDYVLIEFGHNDGNTPGGQPDRGSLPGLGDETVDIARPGGTHETVHTFGWYIRRFIADAKAAGAHPILLSPTVRNIWNEGKVERAMGHFAEWSAAIAQAEGVPFLDHTNAIADAYEKLGPQKVAEFFPEDHTHTSQAGADLNASLVAAAIKGQHSPLAASLSSKGQEVPAYPAKDESARRAAKLAK